MAENIHSAIHAVMSSVGYVQKQHAQGLNYTYAGERALIAALRPAMLEQGIYCYVAEISQVTRDTYTTAKGAVMQSTALVATIRFVHAASETSIDVMSAGEGSDSGDKSQNKALTGAYKYALRQTFCIETGDDPDAQSSEDMARPAVSRGAPPPHRPEQQPSPPAQGVCRKCGAALVRRKDGSGVYCSAKCWQNNKEV